MAITIIHYKRISSFPRSWQGEIISSASKTFTDALPGEDSQTQVSRSFQTPVILLILNKACYNILLLLMECITALSQCEVRGTGQDRNLGLTYLNISIRW